MLLGAPVGLAWGALAPRVEVLAAGGDVRVVDATSRVFLTSDAWFVGLTAIAGLAVGLAAALLGRRHGLGCVVGLAVGGLVAAEVARRTGPLVGLEEARAFLAAGGEGLVEVPARLRLLPALAVWPLAALLAHLAVVALRRPPAVSSG